MVIGVKIEKIWDNVSIGGGVKKNPKMSQFQFGSLENRGGGSVFFSQKYQLFDSEVCNITFIRNV